MHAPRGAKAPALQTCQVLAAECARSGRYVTVWEMTAALRLPPLSAACSPGIAGCPRPWVVWKCSTMSGTPCRFPILRSSAVERCSGIVCGQSQFADEHAGCDQRRSLTSIHNERSASRVATCSAARATTNALKQPPESSAAEIWAACSLTDLRRFFGNFVSVSRRSSAGAPDEGGRDSTAASCFQSPDSTQAPPNSRPTASVAKSAKPNNAATAPPRPARLYAAARIVSAAPASKYPIGSRNRAAVSRASPALLHRRPGIVAASCLTRSSRTRGRSSRSEARGRTGCDRSREDWFFAGRSDCSCSCIPGGWSLRPSAPQAATACPWGDILVTRTGDDLR